MEGYLRSHFPNEFRSNEWLGDFVAKIEAGNEQTFGNMKKRIGELIAIKDFSKRFHHSEQRSEIVQSPLTDGELTGWVNRTLEFIRD